MHSCMNFHLLSVCTNIFLKIYVFFLIKAMGSESQQPEGEKVESKKAAKKEAKKAEKAAKKAEKSNAAGNVSEVQEGNIYNFEIGFYCIKYYAVLVDVSEGKYGNFPLIRSDRRIEERKFTYIKDLNKTISGNDVWVRARLHTSRARGKQCFIVLRQREYTVQVLVNVSEKISKAMVKFTSG